MAEKKICGIYKITSPSGRVYIGQSDSINRRFKVYKKLHYSVKTQKKLYPSLEKYGAENHIFEIIEECSEEDLNCRERFWQDYYDVLNGGLNCILQECGAKRRVLSEEASKRMSERFSGENNPMFGYKYSETQLQAMRDRNSGENGNFYGRHHTQESIDKRNETFKANGNDYNGSNNPNAREVIDTVTKVIYYTVDESAKANGVSVGVMSRYLNNPSENATSCVFLKDYEEGMIIVPYERAYARSNRVEDITTGIEYRSIRNAVEKLGITTPYQTLIEWVKKEDIRTTLRYITD